MILDISSWWSGLPMLAQILWIIAIPGTILFLIQLVLTFVGGDADAHAGLSHDASFDHPDQDFGHHFFTVKNLIAFFTIFAWSGLGCVAGELGTFLTLFISLFLGLLMMVVMATLFYFMTKLTDSGTLDMKNAIGQIGEVYFTIPAKKAGTGQVQVKVQGTLRTLDAMTTETEEIKSRTMIEVVDVLGENILLVRRNR
jgi:membrane protein implicated in regulation of membrane protease activity